MDGLTITVKVTAQHIDTGVPNNCHGCPIVLALAAVLPPGCSDIEAGYGRVGFEDPDGVEQWAEMPKEGWQFIGLFDTGRPVEPFSMPLRFAPRVYR